MSQNIEREENNEMAQMKPMVKKDMINKSWWCQGYDGWGQWEGRSDLRKGTKGFTGLRGMTTQLRCLQRTGETMR